jgi:hypothetical protein
MFIMRSIKTSQQIIIAIFLALTISIFESCDDLLDPLPANYPARFTFSGYVLNNDSMALNQIRVILKTPNNLDSVTALTDSNGFYQFKYSLEFAGPNRLTARDTDGSANGGAYYPSDTMFYINQEQYDSRRVVTHFVLKVR